ncbi:MAG: hypothetical protein FJ288_11555 [Planctomycetes bacterium]|nr:hypothetical protein [Planctomycetota bacterium]
MGGFLACCEEDVRDPRIAKLFRFAAFCVLEEVSFTRKDGQYLRWDHRSARRHVRDIARMVRNYFYEMAFVVYELARVLKPGGRIVMVNDKVRYAGEEVPVDLILSDFAESFGLRTGHIWTLPRGKGNSSQQMGAHGRRELRKCVCMWEKPPR